ncbi:MAG: autotransporter domain-containing protein, partial [Pseudolabrys sp.]
IKSDAGIGGFAAAIAIGIGSPNPEPGIGKGGTASATVAISNSGLINATNGYTGGYGIIGGTYAVAGAFGRQATGGVAVASTTITSNGPTILASYGGISGSATALSDGFGVYGIKGLAKGGTATAGATITNVANIYSGYGAGIAAVATASANGLLIGTGGPVGYGNGVGGTASATATITNSGLITTYGSNAPGILAISYASANGSLTGGVVSAVSSISNSGATILTYGSNSPGIVQLSTVSSNGGYTGGTATTSTTVNNTATIIATGRNSGGIYAGTSASANASVNGYYRVGGTAGRASASTTVNNSAFINVTGAGIYANSQAYANGWKGGNAQATTVVNSSGPKIIVSGGGSFAPGIAAYSTAQAYGLGGTASAGTTVTNSAVIQDYGGWRSPGIIATAYAGAGTLLTGKATAGAYVNNTGNIITSGARSGGIEVYSGAYAGSATSANATSSVTNSGGITTSGWRSAGIVAIATAAGVNGFDSGSLAPGNSSGKAIAIATITNTGAIKTYGSQSPGLFAATYAVGNTATATTTVLNSASIAAFGSGAGILASSYANGNYGANDAATATTLVSNSGNIVTYGHGSLSAGINASAIAYGTSASTTVSNGGNITTFGNDAPGIIAYSYAFTASGTAVASVVVTNSGSIWTYGSRSPGISAYAKAIGVQGPAASNATVLINNSGTVITSGSFSPAIYAKVNGDTSITINNAATGVLKATGRPYTVIEMVSYNGLLSTINNTINNAAGGLIQGNIQSYGLANNTFNNAGTWVMQGNSNFSNTFTRGTNTVNNTGLVTVLNTDRGNRHRAGYGLVSGSNAPGLYVAGSVFAGVYTGGHPPRFYTTAVRGLTNWNNDGGTISLINGNANQQLLLSGNFNGTQSGPVTSTLKVDANLGGPPISAVPPTVSKTTTSISILGFPVATSTVTTVTSPGVPAYVGARSDILGVAGNVTGVTQVVVNDTNPGLGVYNPVGIPVVIVGGTTDATNFVLKGGPIVKGLFDYDIYLNAPKNVWVLASTPGQAANELPRLITAAQDVWHQEAGVWADRSADLRAYYNGAVPCDPRMITKAPCTAPSSIGPGVWFRAFGDWSHNGGTADETLFGKTHSQDVSYHQDIYGMQVGLDFAAERRGYENFIFGLMAGAVDSKVDFASGTSTKFSGGNLGLYATLINGNFFVDALLLADFLNITYNHSTLLTSTAGSVNNIGGHVDMGYRFNMKNNWFWEPLATVDAVWTDFRKLDLPGVALDLNTNDNENLRGRLGVRVGTSYLNGGYRIEPSVTAGVWHAFAGDNSGMLTSGVYTLNLTDASSHLTYGEVGAAVNVVELGSRWSGYVKGDVRFGDDYWGGSVKGGARFQW